MNRLLFFLLLIPLFPWASLADEVPRPAPTDDLDLLIENANYYSRQALGNGPTKAPEILTDPERALLVKAASYWKRAIRHYPWRLDVRFDLARLYQGLGDFESQYAVLAQATQYADKNRKKMKWTHGEELPDKLSELIPEVLQESVVHYFDRQDPADDEKALRLARLSLTFYPKHPYAYNSLAVYFFKRQDWPRTLKYFLLASQKDPQDGLILGNIGCVLAEMGKRAEARIYWQKVLDLDNDPELTEQARKRLEEMDQEVPERP